MKTTETPLQVNMVEEKQGLGVRSIAACAILLAVGTILHLISPSLGGITPNWTIAMYCIAINLVRPTFKQALGIGAVAGALNIPTSKSAFPYGNMASEPLGALVCALIVHLQTEFLLGRFSLKPGISAGVATVASGATFITILKLVLSLPMHVYLYAMWPVVLTVAAVNAVVTQTLFPLAARIFRPQGVINHGDH
jgi:hypothetical protein